MLSIQNQIENNSNWNIYLLRLWTTHFVPSTLTDGTTFCGIFIIWKTLSKFQQIFRCSSKALVLAAMKITSRTSATAPKTISSFLSCSAIEWSYIIIATKSLSRPSSNECNVPTPTLIILVFTNRILIAGLSMRYSKRKRLAFGSKGNCFPHNFSVSHTWPWLWSFRHKISEVHLDLEAYKTLDDSIVKLIELSDDERFAKARALVKRIRTRDLYKQTDVSATNCPFWSGSEASLWFQCIEPANESHKIVFIIPSPIDTMPKTILFHDDDGLLVTPAE